jgi:hypothetical protein
LTGGPASEWGQVPGFVLQEDGNTFVRIPRMQFPVDANGWTTFVRDYCAFTSKVG